MGARHPHAARAGVTGIPKFSSASPPCPLVYSGYLWRYAVGSAFGSWGVYARRNRGDHNYRHALPTPGDERIYPLDLREAAHPALLTKRGQIASFQIASWARKS